MDTQKWTDPLDAITTSFRDEFGTLTADQLNRQPDANTWSIAQNIDHLIVVNGTYAPVIERLKRNEYKLLWFGRIGFITKFFGRTVLNAVEPDRKKKMKTFPIWEPTKSILKGDILKRFEEHQNDLKLLISSSGDLLDEGAVIHSPASKFIVYKLETAFDIIISHELRHLVQAKEIAKQLERR